MSKRQKVERSAIEIMNAKKFKIGETLEGLYFDKRERLVNDKRTGELKPVTDLLFKTDAGTSFAIPEDAGLRVAMSEFNVKQGEYLSITKKEQVQYLGNALNQYTIEVYE